MSTVLGSLRRLALAPALSEVGFARRGFPGPSSPATARLEAIPRAVVCGFEWGIDCRGLEEVQQRVELVDEGMRGFAYEGVTMAFTVLDAMGSGRRRRTRELLRGPGAPHLFLAYIGIGFAMARLPRPLWRKVVPELDPGPFHPTMTWLAVDGYGFDLAYFDVAKWVDEQRRPAPYDWQGHRDYFGRAVDQGIGRALWFIHGARVLDVDAAVRRFAPERHADLFSGVGLAATFAGGCGEADLATLRREAGEHAPSWRWAACSRCARGCTRVSCHRTRRWRRQRCPGCPCRPPSPWPTTPHRRPTPADPCRRTSGGGPTSVGNSSRRRPPQPSDARHFHVLPRPSQSFLGTQFRRLGSISLCVISSMSSNAWHFSSSPGF